MTFINRRAFVLRIIVKGTPFAINDRKLRLDRRFTMFYEAKIDAGFFTTEYQFARSSPDACVERVSVFSMVKTQNPSV